MGGQASWLIPAALIGLVALLWLSRRSPRTDRTCAAALIWGGWLALTGLVFSYMSGIIHPYYTIALAPAIGALTGIAAAPRGGHAVASSGAGAGSASAGGQPGAGRFPGGAPGRGLTDGGTGGGGLGRDTHVSSTLTKLLENGAVGYTWVAATVGAESAAPLQLASGDPIMAIGGFNGTDPAPTLGQFEKLVSEHKIHYFVGQNQASFGGGTGDAAQITSWVEKHFTSQTIAGITVYNLTSPASS